MRVPIQIHVSLCISLRSRNFFTHRAVVATYAQCFGIGTRIHFEQLREDRVSTFTSVKPLPLFQQPFRLVVRVMVAWRNC